MFSQKVEIAQALTTESKIDSATDGLNPAYFEEDPIDEGLGSCLGEYCVEIKDAAYVNAVFFKEPGFFIGGGQQLWCIRRG